MHTVHFPKDRAVGQLMRVVRHRDKELWEDIADAQGTVTIPADEQLILALDNTTDLSPLDDFHPDALCGLQLWKLFALRDEELRHVGRLTGLRYLSLSDAWEITDAGVAHLAGLVHLEELDLTETTITDVGLAYLSTLANVRTLSLWGTRVGDSGLRHIRKLAALENVLMPYTKITDRGLHDLAANRNLKRLDIRGTNITTSRVEALQRLLPDCAITM